MFATPLSEGTNRSLRGGGLLDTVALRRLVVVHSGFFKKLFEKKLGLRFSEFTTKKLSLAKNLVSHKKTECSSLSMSVQVSKAQQYSVWQKISCPKNSTSL